MNLYHYTGVTLAENILASGLNNGHVWRASGAIESPIVWLTSDQSHEGHGLLTGAEKFGEKERDYAEQATGIRPKNDFVIDKTRVRFKVRVSSDDRHLVSYVKYCMKNGDGRYWAKLMGLSAFYNIREIDQGEIRDLMHSTLTKEQSWYLYHETIPPNQIVEMEYRTESGFVPYDFEGHGRAQMIFEGQIPVSAMATEQLQSLFKPRFCLDRISAFVQYSVPLQTSLLMIRGCGIHIIIDVLREVIASGVLPSNGTEIFDWVRRDKYELIELCDMARERFFFFNPRLDTA